MGSTNTTTNYQLSQFISTDKPAWLQDYNGDMTKIDNGIHAAKVAADSAQSTADSAVAGLGTASSDITALQTTVAGQTTSIANNAGAINTIQSLIGNGTPTTTDQTIIGAINEINAKTNDRVIASVTGDGVKTYSQIYNELFAGYASAYNSLTPDELHKLIFILGNSSRVCNNASQTELQFFGANILSIAMSTLNNAGSTEKVVNLNNPGTPIDYSNVAAPNGTVYKLLLPR